MKKKLHIVLKRLPHEYHASGSAMRTHNETISFEDIHVLLTSEEQSLKDSSIKAFLTYFPMMSCSHNLISFDCINQTKSTSFQHLIENCELLKRLAPLPPLISGYLA